MIRTAVLLFSFLVSVQAGCDNSCSGHGVCECGFCECYDNWGMGLSHDTGDCSDRICPFELAWVDTPDKKGKHHKYAECAGRGICDRTSGECECFDGYEGKGCQRTTCPNDCSGHGVCAFAQDMAIGAPNFDTIPHEFSPVIDIEFHAWDRQKTRGCICDPEYGDADCSKRMCPYGNDMQDRRLDQTAHVKYQKQLVQFAAPDFSTVSGSFSISFTSKLNETFTTIPIVPNFGSVTASKWMTSVRAEDVVTGGEHSDDLLEFATAVRAALKSLPNNVIDDCVVEVVRYDETDKPTGYSCGGGAGEPASSECVDIQVQFNGENVRGPQNLLEVRTAECLDGCFPQIKGLVLTPSFRNQVVEDENSQADFNSYECGRRGKCDYETGVCECFEGFTGQSCSQCTSLI